MDKLKVLYSSNSLPDTFSTGGYNLIDSMKDQLVDLTDYVDDDWKKLATDTCWDVNSRDGKICNYQKKWIHSLKRHSTLISQSGEIQRMMFFNEQRKIVDML